LKTEPNNQIEIKVSEVIFHQEFYPREKPRTATIEQYIDVLRAGDVFPPIELDGEGLVLLDGYHRWKAHQEAGIETISAKLITLNGLPRLLYAAGRNSLHGDRLSGAEKKEVARQMAGADIKQAVIQEQLRVSAGTISNWVSDITIKKQRRRDARIWWLHRLGWTQEEIGEMVGIDQGNISRICKTSELKKRIEDQFSRGHSPQKIAEAEDIPPELVEALLLDGKSDIERLEYLKIGIQPYDVWNFSGCDARFGTDYPGRIPGQIIANLLYFFTDPGALVVDPMAGSGTAIDVCSLMDRKIYAYDLHPLKYREDILHCDLIQGWPARAAQAQLIFWDPPYFDKKNREYGEGSISSLTREEYLAFFARAFHEAFSMVKQGTKLALIVSPWNDEMHPEKNICTRHYESAMENAGWTILRKIDCPLSTQQVHPDIVNKFKASRRLARLSRSISIGEKR
jgi:DNA modification methylase/ParB-like chromosome segregation protein Spo0J